MTDVQIMTTTGLALAATFGGLPLIVWSFHTMLVRMRGGAKN